MSLLLSQATAWGQKQENEESGGGRGIMDAAWSGWQADADGCLWHFFCLIMHKNTDTHRDTHTHRGMQIHTYSSSFSLYLSLSHFIILSVWLVTKQSTFLVPKRKKKKEKKVISRRVSVLYIFLGPWTDSEEEARFNQIQSKNQPSQLQTRLHSSSWRRVGARECERKVGARREERSEGKSKPGLAEES